MANKDYLVERILSFLVLIIIWFEGETINVNNACSARADGVCEKCDGFPQCFDLSDEIDCPNSTINMEAFKQRAPKCTRDACAGRIPGPPPLPPFSLCSHVKTSPPTLRTTTHSPIGTSLGDATYYITTQSTISTHRPSTIHIPSLMTTSTEAMSRSTTTHERTYGKTQSTPNLALSSTQWLPTTTVRHMPEFMTVWWSCCTIYYRIEETVLCVNRYYRCLRTGSCLQPLRIVHTTISPLLTFNNNVARKNRDLAISTPMSRSSEFLKRQSPFYSSRRNYVPKVSQTTRTPAFQGKSVFSHHLITKSPTVRLPYKTTTIPVTVTAPSLQESFYNPNFSHDRLTDNDLMYALMVLGQF